MDNWKHVDAFRLDNLKKRYDMWYLVKGGKIIFLWYYENSCNVIIWQEAKVTGGVVWMINEYEF